MYYQVSNMRLRKASLGRVLFLKAISLLIATSWMVSPTSLAKKAPAPTSRPDPDTMLIQVYKDLAANDLSQAEAKIDALVEAYPNFHLAHLIRGDLLLMHTRPVTTLGAIEKAPADKLKDLRDEAMVRLKSLRQRPDPDLVPQAILQLRDDQKYALIVDTKQSRLYVYHNQAGQLKLMTDYYVSQGKLGINKVKEGDQKTPVGVSHITSHLSRKPLPDFYGSGALPINYPHEWDKINGRSGSGIWLHGTPSNVYSRPPLASAGCVVLTNPDFEKLQSSIEIGKTPVIITEQAEFINKTKWNGERTIATKMIDGWRRDIESMNNTRILANYSQKFKSVLGEDSRTWLNKNKLPQHDGANDISVKVRDMSLFRYPGQNDMLVSVFMQDTAFGKKKISVRKRQYWAKEGTQWKIIAENNI